MELNKHNAEEVKRHLEDLLNECLESCNQERSFTVTDIDLDAATFSVEFNIAYVEEDDYIGFAGY